MPDKPAILYRGLAFGESPRWHDSKLWFSDMHSRKVMTIDLKGKAETVIEVPDRTSGLGWTLDGHLLIVGMKKKSLLRFGPSRLTRVADIGRLASGDCNDMVVDALGRAYIGNFGLNTDLSVNRVGPGEIVMVAPDGRACIVADNLNFPNGSVITPDGCTLIVAETFGHCLTAFDINQDGSLTRQRTWAALPKDIFPDGMCLDAEGAVWVGHAGGPAVYRVKEGGEITRRIETSAHAYACMLGGEDRRTLFIMTAEDNDAAKCRQKMNGRIEIIRVDVPGAGLP